MRIFILFPAFSFITISSSAKNIFVDDNASAGGDGTSWTSAHKYLQDALASAEYGDEIWVAEGTYKPDQGAGKTVGDRTASLTWSTVLDCTADFWEEENANHSVIATRPF